MGPTELTQETFTSQFRTMPQHPPAPPEGNDTPRPSLHRTGAAVDFDAETIRAIRDRQDAIAAERYINETAEQANAIDFAARAMGLVSGDRTVVGGISGGITTVPDRAWQDAMSKQDSFNFRHFESKIIKLEKKLAGAKDAIEMLIEEYGKLAKKLDEREEEHTMLISELYKLKKAGEK